MEGFISYAHKDKSYFDILSEGIKTHSAGSQIIDWEIWSDNTILVGEDWDDVIHAALERCNFAILLLSANFFASEYIQEYELSTFIKKKKTEGFIFFPVLISDFEYNKFTKVARVQFFRAFGEDYGVHEKKGELISYDHLVRYDNNGNILPNNYLETYHKNLVNEIEKAISKYSRRVQNTPDYTLTNYGIPAERQKLGLQEVLADLNVNSPIILDLHRVNCDRIGLTKNFWAFFDQTDANTQFYIIAGDSYHQPDSFAERLVYELEDELKDSGKSIYFKRDVIKGVKKHSVRLDRESVAKREFRIGFSEMVSPERDRVIDYQSLEEFIATGSPTLKHDYIAVIFKMDTSFYPINYELNDYLSWIRNTYCKVKYSKVKFMFFMVFSMHSQQEVREKRKFNKAIKSFVSGKQNVHHSTNFQNVRIHDLVRWFSNHLPTEADAEELVDGLIKHIDSHFTSRFTNNYFSKESESFQMSFVQKVLNAVCEMYK